MHTCAHIHIYTCLDSRHMTTHICTLMGVPQASLYWGAVLLSVFWPLFPWSHKIAASQGGRPFSCLFHFYFDTYILLKWSKLKGLKLTIRALSLKCWPCTADFSRGRPLGCSQSFVAIYWTEAVWANQSWSANLQFPVQVSELRLPISSEFHKTPSLDSSVKSVHYVDHHCHQCFPSIQLCPGHSRGCEMSFFCPCDFWMAWWSLWKMGDDKTDDMQLRVNLNSWFLYLPMLGLHACDTCMHAYTVLQIKPRASCIQGKHSTNWAACTALFPLPMILRVKRPLFTS